MSPRRRGAVAVAVVALALLVPAAASAHAYSDQDGSGGERDPEPARRDRAAHVRRGGRAAVRDHLGHRRRCPPGDDRSGDALAVRIRTRSSSRSGTSVEGWYLVYWRAISVDGHPVQGAFTFAVGPNAGPTPQFVIPHIAGTATSTPLVIAKWLAFLTVMAAIGLFVLRIAIARPLVRRVSGTSLRALTIALRSSRRLGLVAIPAYLEEAIAIDSLRSFWNVTSVVPLWRLTAFGRGYVDVELCFALFVARGDRRDLDRPTRSARAGRSPRYSRSVVRSPRPRPSSVLPGAIGHAGQTAPRGVAVLLDWLHLVSGSLWFGGLIGLLVVWRSLAGRETGRRSRRLRAALLERRPRFRSRPARHRRRSVCPPPPVLDALWLTTYGKVILIKAGILLAAMLLASINLLQNKPGLARAEVEREVGTAAAGARRRSRRCSSSARSSRPPSSRVSRRRRRRSPRRDRRSRASARGKVAASLIRDRTS